MIDPDYIVRSYRVELTDARHGDLYIVTVGPEHFVRSIKFHEGATAKELDDIAYAVLSGMGYQFKLEKKEKSNIETVKPNNSVFLAKAGTPKVFLQKADFLKDVVVYRLKYKPDKKWVIRIDDRGFYTSDSPKCEPMNFTSRDIGCIGNLQDFDVVKMTIKSKREIADKIYGK